MPLSLRAREGRPKLKSLTWLFSPTLCCAPPLAGGVCDSRSAFSFSFHSKPPRKET